MILHDIIIHKIVQEWPLTSTLDPDVYGPPESAITTELVEREIKTFMTIDVVPTFLLLFLSLLYQSPKN